MCSKRWAKPVRPGRSLRGPTWVPEVDCDEGQAMVFVGDDLEAVGQGEGLVLDLGDLESLGIGGDGREQQRGGDGGSGEDSGQGVQRFHEASGQDRKDV